MKLDEIEYRLFIAHLCKHYDNKYDRIYGIFNYKKPQNLNTNYIDSIINTNKINFNRLLIILQDEEKGYLCTTKILRKYSIHDNLDYSIDIIFFYKDIEEIIIPLYKKDDIIFDNKNSRKIQIMGVTQLESDINYDIKINNEQEININENDLDIGGVYFKDENLGNITIIKRRENLEEALFYCDYINSNGKQEEILESNLKPEFDWENNI